MKQNNSNLKRGLLELDLILQSFYIDTYKKLDNDSKINFNKLLQMDDIKLLKLILESLSNFL
jgi:succinate dehydrogenase flavin-adding protein (antitoxin of CptAB toxin-antitoxin module)